MLARWVEPEEDNFRALLDWCSRHDPESGLVLVGALNYFWMAPTRREEGRRWIAELLDRAPAVSPAIRAGALVALGSIANSGGEEGEALRLHAEALRLYREAGDAFGAATAEQYVAHHLCSSGDTEACLSHLEVARQLAESTGNLRALLGCLHVRSYLALGAGDVEGYVAQMTAARGVYLAAGGTRDAADEWLSDNNMAYCLYLAGRPHEARAISVPLVDACRERGEVEPNLWDTAGRIDFALGMLETADTFFRQGLEAAVSMNSTGVIAALLDGLASVALCRGQSRRAAGLFGAASTVRADCRLGFEPAEVPRRQRELAELHAALGDEGAETALAEGRALSRMEAIALARAG